MSTARLSQYRLSLARQFMEAGACKTFFLVMVEEHVMSCSSLEKSKFPRQMKPPPDGDAQNQMRSWLTRMKKSATTGVPEPLQLVGLGLGYISYENLIIS